MRSYEAARTLFSGLAFCAWSVVVIGGIVALIGLGSVSKYAGGGAGLLAMIPGISIALAGLLLVAFVQIGRANVDTAEYTQQMLKISRDQLDVSKQSLKQGDTFQKNYASPNAEAKDTPTDEGYSKKTAKPEKAVKPESVPVKQIEQEIPYEGHTILAKDDKFHVDKAIFENIELAKDHIDLLHDKEEMAVKITALNAIPVPKPEPIKQEAKPVVEAKRVETPPIQKPEEPEANFNEYKGKRIEISGDTFVCNGIPFKTMDAARNYIDNFAITASRTLPGVRRS